MTRLRKPFATNLLSICKKININRRESHQRRLQFYYKKKWRVKMYVPFMQTFFFLFSYYKNTVAPMCHKFLPHFELFNER